MMQSIINVLIFSVALAAGLASIAGLAVCGVWVGAAMLGPIGAILGAIIGASIGVGTRVEVLR